MLRELNRGGQVFYLHNRILTIELDARAPASACCRGTASASATGR